VQEPVEQQLVGATYDIGHFLLQVVHGPKYGRALHERSIIENYLKGVLEVHLHLVVTRIGPDTEPYEFCAAFYSLVRMNRDVFHISSFVRHGYLALSQHHAADMKEAVLVDAREFMQDEQLALRIGRIPSGVRLQRLDECQTRPLDSSQLIEPAPTTPGSITLSICEDRKLRVLIGPPPIVDHQLVDHMVKGAPKVVQGLAQNDRDHERRLDSPDLSMSGLDENDAFLRLIVYLRRENVSFRVEGMLHDLGYTVELISRPQEFRKRTFKWFHLLSSRRDGQTDAKDRQGSRDPRVEARGGHARLEEVGKGVTAAPTGEIASRTAPAYQSGGCTAKRKNYPRNMVQSYIRR
jgi:hypothetical protein